jgi:hypothetical protein
MFLLLQIVALVAANAFMDSELGPVEETETARRATNAWRVPTVIFDGLHAIDRCLVRSYPFVALQLDAIPKKDACNIFDFVHESENSRLARLGAFSG